MAKYRTKKTIEARQVSKASAHSIMTAINRKTGAGRAFIRLYSNGPAVVIRYGSGELSAKCGDWIWIDPDENRAYAMSDAAFNETYEKA